MNDQASETSRRFGNRAQIDQPAVLAIDDREISGVIHNVGLRGAFFVTSELPRTGTRGVLTRAGGRPVAVRVVWQRNDATPGVGLSFG